MMNVLAIIATTATLTFVSADVDVDSFCGYAPLCGTDSSSFDWQTRELSSTNLLSAELRFNDCCNLRDTQPTEQCQLVNPGGESVRVLSASKELCGFRGSECEEGECNEYNLVIKPNFLKQATNEKCCDSCTCFGDPQCIAFNGEEKMWALCDGREVPRESSIWEMCRITEEQCSKERDHQGNVCQYKSEDIRGRDWTVGKQGSPCVPNENSDTSVITMYKVEDAEFEVKLEQGERGIIKKVVVDMKCGSFSLTADDCVNKADKAWTSEDVDDEVFEKVFSYVDVVHGLDELWTFVDPDSGVSVSVRCHANHYDGDSEKYVPRINIEDLSDPVSRGGAAEGFCVSGEFDVGQATTANTLDIFENERCTEGLQDSSKRDIYRAMCKNPGLPSSGHESCVFSFCDKHYLPNFRSIEQCEDAFKVSLADGFCKGVTYSIFDADVCVDKWFDLGAIETITEYYDDAQGCSSEVQETLSSCQSGIIVQFFRNNRWNDEVAIPSDFCNDEDIVLSYCDHQYLFNRPVRIVQKTAAASCGPQTVCTSVEGFVGTFELQKTTPFPTSFPSDTPTSKPTSFPTPFPVSPTSFPTPFPIEIGSLVPTVCPTEPLCGTDNENVEYDEDDTLRLSLDECCVDREDACAETQTRTQSTKQWYCGVSDGEDVFVNESVSKLECEENNEVTVQVSFSHETECCKKCTCFGDPRCYSFDGAFEEFILCDGRTPSLNEEDDEGRCVIRKDTCEQQTDHEGNNCKWTNPSEPVPEFSDAVEQEKAERAFQVARHGSPCRYDTSLSSTASLLMYAADDYRVEVDHGERGYIQTVHLTTGAGEFVIGAERCVNGDDWETVGGEKSELSFKKTNFGQEVLWSVEDLASGILLKIRCTGQMYEGDLTSLFINVEGLFDWDDARISESEGFCATGDMPEKRLASTEHSEELLREGSCDNWNAETSEIVTREVARVITNNPGVTLVGTETAYRGFCTTFFSPGWSSVSKCVNAFMQAKDVKQSVSAFCRATSRQTEACEENLEVLAEEEGYKSALREGYETNVVNSRQECELKFGDLPEELSFSEDKCETGVELQFFNPRKDAWVTYAAFPDTGGPCAGYKVKALYRYHPKLFKNELRLVQKYDTTHCSQCQQVSSVQAFISFNSEPVGSF